VVIPELSDLSELFPCPCCGFRVFTFPPGYHQVCPICSWEDNLAQLRFPLMPGGANRESLQVAQQNYREYGAVDRQCVDRVREPDEADRRDPGWRPLDPGTDNVEQPQSGIKYADSYPEDTTVLYYWRRNYWRRIVG
jgi:hypothetical protein